VAGFLVAAIVIPSVYMAIGLVVVELSNHWSLITLINNFLPSIVVLALAIMLAMRSGPGGPWPRRRHSGCGWRTRNVKAEAARRVAEERLRIARDRARHVAQQHGHDHGQAGSALHVLGDRDEKIRAALTAIR